MLAAALFSFRSGSAIPPSVSISDRGRLAFRWLRWEGGETSSAVVLRFRPSGAVRDGGEPVAVVVGERCNVEDAVAALIPVSMVVVGSVQCSALSRAAVERVMR